jgi:hypothetical protein
MNCRRAWPRLRWLWGGLVLALVMLALLAFGSACEEEGEARPAPAATPTAEATSPPDAAHAPEATPTPEKTATAEPSATEDATGLTTEKVSDYSDSLGILHVVGEVKNNQVFDADDEPLTTDFAFSCLKVVPAGGDSPFEIKVLDPPPGIDRYELEAKGEEASEPPGLDLEFSDVTAWMDFLDTYHLLGEVTNQSGTTYEWVRICGALYGPEGEVVRSDLTFVCEEAVGPGESAEFWLEEPVSGVLVDHHRLWAQGE